MYARARLARFVMSKKEKTKQRETRSRSKETSSGGSVERRSIYARGERGGQRGALEWSKLEMRARRENCEIVSASDHDGYNSDTLV